MIQNQPKSSGATPKRPVAVADELIALNDLARRTNDSLSVWRKHVLHRQIAYVKLAEAGVPESTMMALAGHMSRSMLERYSHIRLNAKRDAVEALNLSPISERVPARPELLPLQ